MRSFKDTVRLVALLNLAYFGVEFSVALAIASVSLFADSVDFLEDASVNFLIFAAVGWSERNRARVGALLAAMLLVPALATLWALLDKIADFTAPAAGPLAATGTGALAVNLACALMLARYRKEDSSLMLGAFLSARNDALANIAIIVAGYLSALTLSAWPDLIVGIGIAILNLDAAREVYGAAVRERERSETPRP